MTIYEIIDKIEEYEDENWLELMQQRQKETPPSYDPDAYADEFNYMERMC